MYELELVSCRMQSCDYDFRKETQGAPSDKRQASYPPHPQLLPDLLADYRHRTKPCANKLSQPRSELAQLIQELIGDSS